MQQIITKKTVFELHKPKDYVKDYIVSHKTISKNSSTATGLTSKVRRKQSKNLINADLNLDLYKTFTREDSRNYNTFNTPG